MNKGWKELKVNVKSFYSEEEESIIHIIETGFRDRYLVVWEEPYDQPFPVPLFISKKEAERLFEIKL